MQEMRSDILHLQSSAETSLQSARSYLIGKTLKTEVGWGLQQFLDEIRPGSTYIGIYGTSCGITALVTCGESVDSPVIQHFRAWLIQSQEQEGGWTLSTFREKDILTTATCYVLNALNDVRESPQSPIVQDGLGCLQRTQNPDRGWGLYAKAGVSKTTPSLHAILTFSRYPEMLRTQTASEGINWILRARNEDHGWGQDPSKPPSTLAHTALAVLTLLSAGYPTYSADVQEPVQWILATLQPDALHTEIEVFYVHHTNGTATGMSYHLPTISLVSRALLAVGIDPLSSEINQLVRILISQQRREGYWLDSTVQGKIPIWTILYACMALREFVTRVDAVRETLGLRQTIVDLTQATRETSQELREVSQRIADIEKQVRPLSRCLLILRRFRVFIVLGIALIVYVYFLFRVEVPMLVNIASAIFGALLALLGIYDARQDGKD